MQICDGESARSPSWAAGVGGGRQRTEEGLSSDEFQGKAVVFVFCFYQNLCQQAATAP